VNLDTMQLDDLDTAFAAFDITDLEVLEVAHGVALPEMGASSGSIGTSSSACSSTCSSSTC
jgi:thiazolylpeptide-type bacteriocin precursor